MTKGRVVVIKEQMKPFVIEEYDVPDPGPGEIILQITQAGICGSDLHTWRGDSVAPIPPQGKAMGHEGTGVVFRLGEGVTTDSLGKPLQEGDRLMYAAISPCNRCYNCARGELNWCVQGPAARVAGTWPYFTGTYADYFYLPANHPVFVVPDELPDSVLGFVNCAMGTITEGLMRAGCHEGDYVVLQGAGGLGLNATAMAKDMGAHKVVVLDRIPERLTLAQEFGADATINIDEYHTPEARLDRVKELTGGRGANIVMELVGRAELLAEGIAFLANGGTFVEIGDIVRGRTVAIDPSQLLRGKKIMGSVMYRPMLLPVMLEMLVKNQGKVPYEKIISNVFPLEEVNEAFAQAEWSERQTQVTRAALVP